MVDSLEALLKKAVFSDYRNKIKRFNEGQE